MKPDARECPHCGSTLDASPALLCPNPDCPARIRKALAQWCAADAMAITDVDDTLIDQLVARGLVLDVADFYRIKFGELLELDGMNEARAEQILATIATSRERPWWRVLTGLSLPGIDAAQAEKLSGSFKNLDDFTHAPRARLLGALGEEQSRKVQAWLNESLNLRLLKRLAQYGVSTE